MRAAQVATGTGMALFVVANFAIGIVQAAAVFAGVEHWLNWHWLVCALISGFLVFILRITPLNVVIGILGAHYAWYWPWSWSIALFVGFLVVVTVISLLVGATQSLFRW